MALNRLVPSPPWQWRRVIAVAAGASATYTAVVYWSLSNSQFSVPDPLLWRFSWDVLLACGSVGVPLALWLRFGYRAPLALMSGLVVFWHAGFPVLSALTGRSPDAAGSSFVFMLAPLYVLLYLLVALVERGRQGGTSRVLAASR